MQIDVWSDYACPWCALGMARLEVVLRDFEHAGDVTVTHRSFELHRRAAARTAGSMEEIVGRRYGLSPDRVRAGHAQLTELGAEVGFAFDFEQVRLGSTFDAHRLSQAARGTAWEAALVRRLFVAHFTRGLQLSDHDVLREVARGAGLPDVITDNVLGSAAYGDEVRADEAAADQHDVTGVPYFLIGGAWPIPGAQDVETLGILLRRAWSRLGH